MTMRRALALLALLACTGAQAATHRLDATNGEIAFAVRAMGVVISGRFERFTVDLAFDPQALAQTRAQVVVDIASLASGDADVDTTAVNADWLDAARHPQARFVTTNVEPVDAAHLRVHGDLTLRDVTRTVVLPLTLQRHDGHWTLNGELPLSRSAYGIGGGTWGGSDVVEDRFTVSVHLQIPDPGTDPARFIHAPE